MHRRSYLTLGIFVFVVLGLLSSCGGPLPSSQDRDPAVVSDGQDTVPQPSLDEEPLSDDDWIDSENFTVDDEIYAQDDPLGSVI